MADTINYLQENGANIGTLWFDVEGQWSSDTDANVQFIQELINQANNLGISYGIYTSESQWNSITDNSAQFGSDIPLWYAHYDNDQSFTDFESFGGWTQPSMKQFAGNVMACGVGIDTNFSNA